MNKGSPEWLDAKILASLDRMWARKGKYCSAYDLMGYMAEQGYAVPLDAINERLHTLHLYGSIEAMFAPNGKGTNALYLLRYSRVRTRY
jgi:hypothetical protein